MLPLREAASLLVVPTLKWMAAASRDPRARLAYAAPAAAAMTLAAGLVESGWRTRWQRPAGPALGWLQCEPATLADLIARDRELGALLDRLGVLDALRRDPAGLALCDAAQVVVFRRLLWSRVAGPLPDLLTTADEEAYRQYDAAQRPGKPRPEAFMAAWRDAVPAVLALWS